MNNTVFPSHLSDLDHLRDEPMIKFKQESVLFDGHEFKFTIVSYMIASPELWSQSQATECRGISFDENGKCVCAPFEKFFNVGENELTQHINLPKTAFVSMSKRDGSMVTPVLLSTGYSKKIVFKTKKSFHSDVAQLANKCATTNVINLSHHLIEIGLTPIFEFTHPDSRIVIDYGTKPEFVLLAARDMVTGDYATMWKLETLCEQFGVRLIPWLSSGEIKLDLKSYFDSIDHEVGIEGVVVWFQTHGSGHGLSGLRVKKKTIDYLKRHRVATGLRERDIAEMVIDEKVDDMKSFASELGYSLDPIIAIENKVVAEVTEIKKTVEQLVESHKHLDRKEFAMTYNGHPLFGLMMKRYTGSEPDYVKYWKQNMAKMYSLATIYTTFGDTE